MWVCVCVWVETDHITRENRTKWNRYYVHVWANEYNESAQMECYPFNFATFTYFHANIVYSSRLLFWKYRWWSTFVFRFWNTWNTLKKNWMLCWIELVLGSATDTSFADRVHQFVRLLIFTAEWCEYVSNHKWKNWHKIMLEIHYWFKIEVSEF